MIGKRVLGLAAIAAFGFGLALAPTAVMAAKKCKCTTKIKDCKANVKASPFFTCTGLKKAAKHTCLKGQHNEIKAACTSKTATCKTAATCSPSGAFLD